MKRISFPKVVVFAGALTLGMLQDASAGSTMVTDAVGTQQLWSFVDILGKQRLVSKINQIDGKGVTQIWDDVNGNLLSKTDEEGRTTSFAYNSANQLISMTEAVGTSQERITTYEYVSSDIDLVARVTSPSVFANQYKEVITSYDTGLNITSTTINGFDLAGNPVTRTTTFDYDPYGKVVEIDGPRNDVNDVLMFEYFDCSSGAECGQLKKVTNALGHEYTFDAYDAAGRLLQSSDPNGVVTTYTYHPRGWVLRITQTPNVGATKTTMFDYDNIGQVTQVTLPNGTQYMLAYDAAHDLRNISDNLGNTVEFTYDPRGNLTHRQIKDPDGTLVRSTVQSYDFRNFVESVNAGGSLTQWLNDAVGNRVQTTDPNGYVSANLSHDALDRMTSILDALSNSSIYEYNVADQVTQVIAPNGARTHFEYDDLGNQTKEISPDRGVLVYAHDEAGNITSVVDDRGITSTYDYDALNRLVSVAYPDASENISYSYDVGANCGAGVGRLCTMTDESGHTQYRFDAWGNVTDVLRTELGVMYVTQYEYDAENRVTQTTYPNGRVVEYQRDVIGRVVGVTSTRLEEQVTILSAKTYRADNLSTGHTLGNGLHEVRTYDTQGRVISIDAGLLATWDYGYDDNGNILQVDKPQSSYVYEYDVLDRLISEADGIEVALEEGGEIEGAVFDESNESFVTTEVAANEITVLNYGYDQNGNRINRNNRSLGYSIGSNLMEFDGNIFITHDAIGNTLNLRGNKTLTYNDAGRLETVSKSGELKATYRYNGFNQRTRKEIPTKRTQVFHYDLAGNLILRTRDDGKPVEDYIWVDGELIQFTKLRGNLDGTIKEIKAKTFITNDHLRTPRLGSDGAQVKTWEWVADAFNKLRPERDPDGDGINVNLKIGFPGQYYDAESGLYYNWHRYYDRKTGRYVTADPIGLNGGMNAFLYARANPLYYQDRWGLISARDVVGAFLTAGGAVVAIAASPIAATVGVSTGVVVAVGVGVSALGVYLSTSSGIDDLKSIDEMDSMLDPARERILEQERMLDELFPEEMPEQSPVPAEDGSLPPEPNPC